MDEKKCTLYVEMAKYIVAGAVGVGLVTMKSMGSSPRTPLNDIVKEYPEIVKWNRFIGASMSEIATVFSEQHTRILMGQIQTLMEHSRQKTRTSSYELNRICNLIQKNLRTFSNNGSSVDIKTLRHQVYIEQDVLPALREILQSIVHNHMLQNRL